MRLDPTQSEILWVQRLPWELLYEPSRQFLAISRGFSIVRTLDVSRPALVVSPQRRLTCLAVTALPRGVRELQIRAELKRLHQALDPSESFELDYLLAAGEPALEEHLTQANPDILHFIGHGWRGPDGAFGLLLEDEHGHPVPVDSRRWAELVVDAPASQGPRLIVLNACSTAESAPDREEPFDGVAQALVAGGVPAVLAMNRPISDHASREFAHVFYGRLKDHGVVDIALVQARRALRACQEVAEEWATPTLYLQQGIDGRLFHHVDSSKEDAPATSAGRKTKGSVKIGHVEGAVNEIYGVKSNGESKADVEGSVEIDKVTGSVDKAIGVDTKADSRKRDPWIKT